MSSAVRWWTLPVSETGRGRAPLGSDQGSARPDGGADTRAVPAGGGAGATGDRGLQRVTLRSRRIKTHACRSGDSTGSNWAPTGPPKTQEGGAAAGSRGRCPVESEIAVEKIPSSCPTLPTPYIPFQLRTSRTSLTAEVPGMTAFLGVAARLQSPSGTGADHTQVLDNCYSCAGEPVCAVQYGQVQDSQTGPPLGFGKSPAALKGGKQRGTAKVGRQKRRVSRYTSKRREKVETDRRPWAPCPEGERGTKENERVGRWRLERPPPRHASCTREADRWPPEPDIPSSPTLPPRQGDRGITRLGGRETPEPSQGRHSNL